MAITILSLVLGSVVMTLPRTLAIELESTDGWISVIINGIFMLILLLLYIRIQRDFPGESLFQYLEKGKIGYWGGKILAIIFTIYLLMAMAMVVRIFVISMEMYVLKETPREIIAAIMLLTTTYAVSKGVQGIVHLNLLFVPVIVVVLLLVSLFNVHEMEFERIMPIMAEGFMPVLKGIMPAALPFLAGGIHILFLLGGMIEEKELKKVTVYYWLSVLTTYLFVSITITSFTVFGLESTKVIVLPTMELAKNIEIPGMIFERMDVLMLTIWVMALFTSIAILQLKCVLLIKDQFLSNKNDWYLQASIVFISYLLAFFPEDIVEFRKFGEAVTMLGVFIAFAGILFAFLTTRLRASKNRDVQA